MCDSVNYRFPKDKFELLELVGTSPYTFTTKDGSKRTHNRKVVKLRCKKCGSIKDSVIDKPSIGCDQGPCHKNFKDLTGNVYGSLRVLSYVNTGEARTPWRWLCICDCGREEIVYGSSLKHGKASCRDCSYTRRGLLTKLSDDGAKWSRIHRQYRRVARKNGLPFELSKDAVRSLCMSDCVYCGRSPEQPDCQGLIRNGIDKQENVYGYTAANVVSCCSSCNIMKAARTPDVFFKDVARIYNHMRRMFNDYPEREYPEVGGNGEDPKTDQFGRIKI